MGGKAETWQLVSAHYVHITLRSVGAARSTPRTRTVGHCQAAFMMQCTNGALHNNPRCGAVSTRKIALFDARMSCAAAGPGIPRDVRVQSGDRRQRGGRMVAAHYRAMALAPWRRDRSAGGDASGPATTCGHLFSCAWQKPGPPPSRSYPEPLARFPDCVSPARTTWSSDSSTCYRAAAGKRVVA